MSHKAKPGGGRKAYHGASTTIYQKVVKALREPQMGVVLSHYADLKQGGQCKQWPLYALCYCHFMLYVTGFSASNGGHFPVYSSTFLPFLSESLTHIFAKFAFLMHIFAEVADLCVK